MGPPLADAAASTGNENPDCAQGTPALPASTMPGDSKASVDGSRPFKGNSLTDCSFTVMPSSADVVLISSASAVTLTISPAALATLIFTFWVAYRLAFITMPFCEYAANPGAATSSE